MAAEIDAITSQIVPSGDGPGAHEAGVIYFIDRALSTFDADLREAIARAWRWSSRSAKQMFPGSATIAALSNEQQIQLMHAIEKTDFFELLRTHTMYGFLGNPSYGGNRDRVGWKLIGFEDRMAFQPPFGYYDAQRRHGGNNERRNVPAFRRSGFSGDRRGRRRRRDGERTVHGRVPRCGVGAGSLSYRERLQAR